MIPSDIYETRDSVQTICVNPCNLWLISHSHDVLRNETRWWPDGLGYTDWDGDGLWTEREKELGTKRFNVDTYGLSRYADAEGAYKIYYLYADQELFCRMKEITAPKGDPTKDWSLNGKQWPK